MRAAFNRVVVDQSSFGEGDFIVAAQVFNGVVFPVDVEYHDPLPPQLDHHPASWREIFRLADCHERQRLFRHALPPNLVNAQLWSHTYPGGVKNSMSRQVEIPRAADDTRRCAAYCGLRP